MTDRERIIRQQELGNVLDIINNIEYKTNEPDYRAKDMIEGAKEMKNLICQNITKYILLLACDYSTDETKFMSLLDDGLKEDLPWSEV